MTVITSNCPCTCGTPTRYPLQLKLTRVECATGIVAHDGTFSPDMEDCKVSWQVTWSDGTTENHTLDNADNGGQGGAIYIRVSGGLYIGVSKLTRGGYVVPSPADEASNTFTDVITGNTVIFGVKLKITSAYSSGYVNSSTISSDFVAQP